ncbi:UL54 multifunctional expression regulator [Leporid alphaherpesvirus 4]|uniref:UL54 multifunctional expression regulator n=1 Tax=Leporid alphaherpesvirus 4 TaxID=481315 RepID=J9QWN0_9ALPH|nr:UL54 multifunctional expression regulator [Leporid alphaherpesvirus 4]AFR32499.1 UL54 multifunctional expression regulator [Leporid alphaherpesvirus 4]
MAESMSTPTDMLVDLGLNLSDSELEDHVPGFMETGEDDGSRTSHNASSGECSSGEEDEMSEALRAAALSGGTEGAAPATNPRGAHDDRPPKPPRAMRSQVIVAPPENSNAGGVWSRLGRRHRCNSEGTCSTSDALGYRHATRRARDAGTRYGGAQSYLSAPGSCAAANDARRKPKGLGRRRRRRARGAAAYTCIQYVRSAAYQAASPLSQDRRPPNAMDAIEPSVMARLHSIVDRISSERIGESVVRGASVMRSPFGGSGFNTAGSSWAPVLAVATAPYNADARRVSWQTLVDHGPSLYQTFAAEGRAASTARVLRECVLRQENLTASLASADELLTWCKMCIHHGLPIQGRDPIVATSGAVLETLITHLRPFMQCYLRVRGMRPLDDLCSRRRLSDIHDIASFMFVILARLANRVERGVQSLTYDTLGVPTNLRMDFYVPGACMAGMIEILDTHRQECSSRLCDLTASYLMSPAYVHGKYFYCNELF